jgi:hypothetical protein
LTLRVSLTTLRCRKLNTFSILSLFYFPPSMKFTNYALPAVLVTLLFCGVDFRLTAQDAPAGEEKPKVDPRGATIIVAIEGSVGVTNNRTGKALPASKVVVGAAIPDGHTVKTGEKGKATFLLSNGTVFTVAPKSEMAIAEFTQEPFKATNEKISEMETEPSISKVTLKLNYGKLVTDVKKLNKGSSFTINSPIGSAGIRGTTVNTEAIPDGSGGFTGSFGVTGGTLAFTPPNAAPGTPSTPVAENQKVEAVVDDTGVASVEAPAPMPAVEVQTLTTSAQEATTASAEVTVAETSTAATTATEQVQTEVDSGAPAEPAPAAPSDPATEPEPAPEPEPTPEPSPEDTTSTEPAAEPAETSDTTIDPSSIDPNVLSPDKN